MTKRKEVYVLIRGGFPQGVYPDRTEAYEDGAALVRELWEKMGGTDKFGLPPVDPSHLLPWWANQVYPKDRIAVIPSPWRDRIEELRNARRLA